MSIGKFCKKKEVFIFNLKIFILNFKLNYRNEDEDNKKGTFETKLASFNNNDLPNNTRTSRQFDDGLYKFLKN